MHPWRLALILGALVARVCDAATTGAADVPATATVVQPASVMESFSPSMALLATDRTWTTLKIVAPLAPAPQATGAMSAMGEGSQRSSVAAGASPQQTPLPVQVPTPSAIPSSGGTATGPSNVLKGPITAALQVTPVGASASSEATGVTRFIVAFN